MSRGFGTRAQPVTKHGVAASARGASTTPTREPRNDACRTPEHPCAGPLPRHDSAESVDAFCPRAAVRTADDTKNESAAFSESWRGIQVGCRSTARRGGCGAPREHGAQGPVRRRAGRYGTQRVNRGPPASHSGPRPNPRGGFQPSFSKSRAGGSTPKRNGKRGPTGRGALER